MMPAAHRVILAAAILLGAALSPAPAFAEIEFFGFRCCYQIPSGSMKPTLKIGDKFGLVKYEPDTLPALGDVVLFKLPKDQQTLFVKRIVGRPGDRVQMIKGALHLNGLAGQA